jgi:hypothetical protein
MALEGTVVNGAVVLDDGSRLPEGARVRLELIEEDELPGVPDASLPDDHPLAPYNREKEIAILRERIEAMKAGEAGIPLEEAMARIAADLQLPHGAGR